MRVMLVLLLMFSVECFAEINCEASMYTPRIGPKGNIYKVEFTVVLDESDVSSRFDRDFEYPGSDTKCGFIIHYYDKGSMIWCESGDLYVQSDRTSIRETSKFNTIGFDFGGPLSRFDVRCD